MASTLLQCTLLPSSAARKANDTIRVHDDSSQYLSKVDISFRRAVRVADGHESSELPPDLGAFPLYPVSSFEGQLPATMAGKGGLFFPMYQREAMWINFKASDPFAINIYLGGVNAISGEPMVENLATQLRRQKRTAEGKAVQDYVTVPEQLWLDGIASAEGVVRQFIALPMGSGYSVEAQITGQDLVGGLQFEITPKLPRYLRPGFKKSTKNIRIFVKTLTGKTVTLDVPEFAAVDEVKGMYQDREGVPPSQQRLIFARKDMEDDETIDRYGICDVSHSRNSRLTDLDLLTSISQQCILHMTLKLHGGGFGRDPEAAMALAAGGRIKQCIKQDCSTADSWNREATREDVPDLGLPYYKIWDETSSIKGNFEGVKSIKAIDQVRAVEKGDESSSSPEPEDEEDDTDEE